MPLNPSGAISLGGPTVGQSIALEIGASATATISLGSSVVRSLAQVPSGAIVMPTNFWGKTTTRQRAIFGFGYTPSFPVNLQYSVTNLVSNTGVVASDTPNAVTGRSQGAAAGYGVGTAIFGFGIINPNVLISTTNLVSATGVLASDTPGVGLSRALLAAAPFGITRALFGFGQTAASPGNQNITNLVSDAGVVASDTPTVASVRNQLAGASYGGDKAIFGFGLVPPTSSVTNLVSNTGVVASNTPNAVFTRFALAAAGYGSGQAIFGFGDRNPNPYSNVCIRVSNTGVLATDTASVAGATGRQSLAGASYGADKAIFGFGAASPGDPSNLTNLISNTGVVAANSPGVGTARRNVAAASYSTT